MSYPMVIGMPEYRVCIERMQNGFEVEMEDPAIIKANNTKDKNGNTRYRDPTVSYGFKTVDEVLAFLKTNLEKALPAETFSSAFDAAVAEGDD